MDLAAALLEFGVERLDPLDRNAHHDLVADLAKVLSFVPAMCR